MHHIRPPVASAFMMAVILLARCTPSEVSATDPTDKLRSNAESLVIVDGVPQKLTAPLHNVSGSVIPPSDLRFMFWGFLQHDELATIPNGRVLIGLQKNTSYFYVWLQNGFWNNYVLYCHGDLKNQSGSNVPVNWLKFALQADLDSNGTSEILGLQTGSSWMYGWSLAYCNNGTPGELGTSARYVQLYPNYNNKNWNGHLVNSSGAYISVDELKFVSSGNWTGSSSGTEARSIQIRGLHSNNAWHYIWGLSSAGEVTNWKWTLAGDGYTRNQSGLDVPINAFRYILENRIDTSTTRATGNFGLNQHELVALVDDNGDPNDGWFMTWTTQANAVRQISACKNSMANCAGNTLVFSLDQGFINGLVANADNQKF